MLLKTSGLTFPSSLSNIPIQKFSRLTHKTHTCLGLRKKCCCAPPGKTALGLIRSSTETVNSTKLWSILILEYMYVCCWDGPCLSLLFLCPCSFSPYLTIKYWNTCVAWVVSLSYWCMSVFTLHLCLSNIEVPVLLGWSLSLPLVCIRLYIFTFAAYQILKYMFWLGDLSLLFTFACSLSSSICFVCLSNLILKIDDDI